MSDEYRVPCGRVLGHGESCTKGWLCGGCKTIEALRGEVKAILQREHEQCIALGLEIKELRADAEKAEAENARLKGALVLAQEAMRDRRDYCLGWEWKCKADWDAEDEAVSKALAGETT